MLHSYDKGERQTSQMTSSYFTFKGQEGGGGLLGFLLDEKQNVEHRSYNEYMVSQK